MRQLLLLLVTAAAVTAAEPGYEEVFDPLDARWPLTGARLAVKKQAFDRVLQDKGLVPLVRQMKKWEAALEKVDDRIAKDFAIYEEAGAKWWGFRQRFIDQYEKKHGRRPADVPIPPNNDDYLAKERAFLASQSIKRRERDLHAYAEARATEVLRGLDGPERAKAVAALAAGLKDRNPHQAVRCADILGAAGHAEAAPALARAAAAERDPGVAPAVLRAYARCAAEGEVLDTLGPYLAHDAWPLRAAAIRGLERVRTRACVELLVGRFAEERGRLLDDLAHALRGLTGQPLGGDGAAWREWWAGAGEDWTPPPAPPEPEIDLSVSPGVASDGSVSFYGTRTRSERVVLCLDARRPDLWKDEAARCIASLPESGAFGIVVFGGDVDLFRKKMADANGTNKKAAAAWLAKIEAQSVGDVCRGAAAALELASGRKGRPPEADTMYLFAGSPAKGTALITDEPQVAQEVVARNRVIGVRIHPVGISTGSHAWWLQTIARPFDGVYVPPPR